MNNQRYRFKALRSLLFFILAGVQSLQAQAPLAREYQVKAGFLYNFSQFIEWPPESFSDNDSPFVIGIFGNDPFGSYIDEVVAGEKTMGHPIIVKRFDNTEDVTGCHILFINGSQPGSGQEKFLREDILTVTDKINSDAAGIIGFFTEAGKIRFNVNIAAARSAKLNISSKLLRVARVTDK